MKSSAFPPAKCRYMTGFVIEQAEAIASISVLRYPRSPKRVFAAARMVPLLSNLDSLVRVAKLFRRSKKVTSRN